MATTIGEAFLTIRPDLSKFEGSMRSGLRARAAVLSAIGAAAVSAGALITIAKPAAAVEQQLDILQAVARATGDQMKQLSDLARTLGADLSLPATSSKDAAIAMTELVKGGLSLNDTMGASKAVLQLVAASTLSTGRAAEITATALNNFGLKGSEAVRVADLLAGAASSASGEVEDMAQALEAVGALARQAGVPIEDVATAIAIMAKNGTIGAEAGYQLRNMFVQLNSVTPKARKLMEFVGFEAFDAAGNMKPLRDIIVDLQRVTSKMTQQARGAFLDEVFGTRASIAILSLLNEGVDGFNAMSEAVGKEGSVAAQAAARNKGLTGAVDGLKSAVETLAIDLGTKLLPRLTEMVRSFAGMVNQANTLGPALREIGAGTVTGFTVARQAAKDLFDFLNENQAVAAGLLLGIAAVGTAIVLSLGPVSLAVLAIAGITAALVGFNTKWDAVFKALPPPVQLAFADVLDAAAEWAMAMSLTFNTVAVSANVVANAILGITKVSLFQLSVMAGAAGQFKRAGELWKQASEVKFNPVPTFSAEDIRATLKSQAHLLREQGEASMRQAAVDAFEAATKVAAAAAAGGDVDAATASRLDTARKALAAASAGATISVDDLIAAAGGAGDAVETLADRMKAAAEAIEAGQTSDVVKAFFDAMIKGTDPNAAIAQARSVISQQDTVWAQLVGTLHNKLGIEVPDEFRSMWEQMTEATKNGARDTFQTWRDELKQRLASVGRLLPNGVGSSQRAFDQSVHIGNITVHTDAAGRVDTKRVADDIAGAVVEARRRTSMAEIR